MAGENFDAMATAFANIAANTFNRRLIFLRPPSSSEPQTDEGGFPIETDTALQTDDDPIPCMVSMAIGKQIILQGKPTTSTIYKVTVPRVYKNKSNQYIAVTFSEDYKVRVLPKGDLPQQTLDIVSGGKDAGPAILFDGVESTAKTVT